MACVARAADFGVDGVFRSGAPRPMKMGTIASPWRYDAIIDYTLQPTNLRWPAILRYASWAAVFGVSQGGPVTLR
jgi:hypothetical protein